MRFRLRFARGSRRAGPGLASRVRRADYLSRAPRGAPRRANADLTRLATARWRALRASDECGSRKAGVGVTLIVVAALLIAVQRFAANTDVPRELRAMVASTNCAARYAALLDLAELARRDGTSSDVVMRGLTTGSGARGAMSECPRLSPRRTGAIAGGR
ncbi:MAG: hypothetical protein PPHEINF_3170 [uncultured Paraburkholderia sp.]|nr:MAG: hypothetical protein PPHEINF_3170 [uncultured Paraburkholderia sp.]CAH2792206.1 MAG: hypothetical protein PPHEESC_3232 [uncultured Paraburkholderia sp.]CAH2926474.1 MAG: hypothetical protein PPHEMADMSA_3139 [uncultured Paraburkholderia sp.]CAH2928850.1 MAG: hypothetical protein PPHERAN_3264 [uncultured Paraburkholderia sp.]